MHEKIQLLRSQMQEDIQGIYDEINDQLSRLESKDIAASLIRQETTQVNIYITGLVGRVRDAAIEELKEKGYPEYLSAGAWTKMIKSVGMPKVRLCSMQQINTSGFSNTQSQNTAEKESGNSEILKRLKQKKLAGIGAAGIGGTALVVALVIPGWEALPITLLCAGSAVLVCGSISTAASQREMETIKSRMEKEQAKAKQYASPVFTKKLTDFQAQNNIQVMDEWIDKIEEAIDNLCSAE